MENKTYHEQKEIEYTKALREYLAELPDFVTTYMRGMKQRMQSRSRLAYAVDLKVFFSWLHDSNPLFKNKEIRNISLNDLESLEPFDIEEYLDYLRLYTDEAGREITNSETALKRKMSALRSLYGYLFKNNMINVNPVIKVDMPKLHKKAIVRLDGDEVSDMLGLIESGNYNCSDHMLKYREKLKNRDLAIITFLLGTGLRVTEFVGINIKDLDMKNSRVKITRKGGYEAYVYFGSEVADTLLPYLNERNAISDVCKGHEDALFLSNQKKRLCVKSVENLVKKYAGLVTSMKHITPHKLRSTYGTALYRETGDIYLVADVLGHKDVNTTRKHYAELEDDRRKSAKDAVKLRKDQRK
ncbi:MAG: tyrosine-type recombinase/integrase [Lachnospiraceae bacterium]|nr:tyrosine-type recombinase/integrase [Lachnospiraceae bacterium]